MEDAPDIARPQPACPVGSYNEWDPLEEVIVGRLEGATIPTYHPVVTFNVPKMAARAYRLVSGFRYPRMLLEPAQRELDEFIHILEAEGVTVRRPDVIDFSRKTRSPNWNQPPMRRPPARALRCASPPASIRSMSCCAIPIDSRTCSRCRAWISASMRQPRPMTSDRRSVMLQTNWA